MPDPQFTDNPEAKRYELAVDGGESRVWAALDKDNPKKIAVRPIPAEVIAKGG